jgi:hypothetical protein
LRLGVEIVSWLLAPKKEIQAFEVECGIASISVVLRVTAGAATALATLHMYRNVERYSLKNTKQTDCA